MAVLVQTFTPEVFKCRWPVEPEEPVEVLLRAEVIVFVFALRGHLSCLSSHRQSFYVKHDCVGRYF